MRENEQEHQGRMRQYELDHKLNQRKIELQMEKEKRQVSMVLKNKHGEVLRCNGDVDQITKMMGTVTFGEKAYDFLTPERPRKFIGFRDPDGDDDNDNDDYY